MIYSKRRFEQWLPANFDGLFDWDFLKPAFSPTKIEPMDIDAMVERNGHFLVFETKEKGKSVPTGQQITLSRLWKEKDFTIIHVEGKTPKDITGFCVYSGFGSEKQGKFGDRDIKENTYIDLTYIVYCWFCKSSEIEKMPRNEWERAIWVADYELNGGNNALFPMEH